MSARSVRTKAKKRAFVKAVRKQRTSAAKAADTVIKQYRMAKLRPGAAGVYRALLNPRVQGFLGLEKKFYDTARVGAAIVTTAAWANGIYNPTLGGTMGSTVVVNCMSAPSQGPGPQQRIGKSITIKNVQLKGRIEIPAVENAASALPSRPDGNVLFLALVQDSQTNGAQCVASDIFTNLTSAYGGCVCPMRNLINSKRFTILKSETVNYDDLCFTNPTAATSVTAARNWFFDWYLPLELPVNFIDETDSDIANVVDNSLHVICMTTGAGCYITYNARIRFLG